MNHSLNLKKRLQQRAWQNKLWLAGLGLIGVLGLCGLALIGQTRMALALAIALPLLIVSSISIRSAILIMLVYLVLLGDLRRLLIPLVGWSGNDPFLLLGGAFAASLCAYALASRSIRLDTPLARWTFALMVVMSLQMFNPRQGGLIVGIGGALFLMVPLLWYWVGRTYATPAFMKLVLFKVMLPLAVLAMVMGIYQNIFGYLPYQMQWYKVAGYIALGSLETGLAPISFFASSTEYSTFLCIALVVLWAAVLHKQRAALVLIPILFMAVFLTGSRGPVVRILVMASGLWAILGTVKAAWVARGMLALFIGAIGLVWSLSQVQQIGVDGPLQKRVDRQAELVSSEGEASTVGIHLSLMMQGYQRAIKEPLGVGLGATTKAAAKFGSSGYSTEVDSSDVLISTGLVGGVMYHMMLFWVILSSIRYWMQTRSLLAMALLGVLGVTFLGWLNGGQYAVSTLVWFCIGALDRFQNIDASEEEVRLPHIPMAHAHD